MCDRDTFWWTHFVGQSLWLGVCLKLGGPGGTGHVAGCAGRRRHRDERLSDPDHAVRATNHKTGWVPGGETPQSTTRDMTYANPANPASQANVCQRVDWDARTAGPRTGVTLTVPLRTAS